MYNENLMHFVNNELNACMRAAYPGVKRLVYVEDLKDERPYRRCSYRQAVIVEFGNGYSKIANVEGDSNFGAMEDVMRTIAG